MKTQKKISILQSVVGQIVNNWIRTEFNRPSRAKCLILIGRTGIGKSTFAKSLPGQYNYFQGRWRLDSWKDSAHYLIFDDIPWDKFDLLGFPPKKALLTQNGLTMVCHVQHIINFFSAFDSLLSSRLQININQVQKLLFDSQLLFF